MWKTRVAAAAEGQRRAKFQSHIRNIAVIVARRLFFQCTPKDGVFDRLSVIVGNLMCSKFFFIYDQPRLTSTSVEAGFCAEIIAASVCLKLVL